MDDDKHNGFLTSESDFDTAKFHQIIVTDPYTRSSCSFTIPTRYINLKFLNAGAQGTVVSAEDTLTGTKVAIKKMQQPFIMTMSARRAYREFILLTTIKHPNIIRLLNAFTPQNELSRFREVYLVMELMSHNLHEVISKLRLDHKTLSFFVYQMLCAIKHLHNSGIIHRDLKPSNIVVNDKCVVKVLDFGLARKKTIDTAMRMSDYVVTRYYRAPEVILGLPYSEKVDIWSVGCIFAEMINHRVLFPGLDRVDQWTKIINVMGTPSEEFISKLGSSAAMYVRSLPRQNGIPIEEIAPDANFLKDTENVKSHLTAECGRDLLSKMLVIDPDYRFSVEESLDHPYVKLWFRDDEVNAPQSENRYNEEIDCSDKPLNEWKELIYNEVKQYERQHDIFGS
ncbi:GLH-binding kinase 1 [Parelaphostrongylus tenuis]|uniref:Stress-activated protein kinase JNK n=1 Tax=Parelaphostrongylus tenuis TaxID=148309 RepID=A0AAD5M8E1_PARTN|nr:GLH-binding kinase 1 [Parelaphostrongylus tenuis]